MTDQDPDTAHSRKPNPGTPFPSKPVSDIESTPHPAASETAFGSLKEMHAYMRLAREWDLRFEKMFRTGALSKWYSSVGNEATTVASACAIEAGDSLLTLHRDSGAILRHYLDINALLPGILPQVPAIREPMGGDSKQRFLRLTCQMLGREHGFSSGHERSYHYNLFEEEWGLFHIGMISHLGSMIPVAAGTAFAYQQQGSDRVAINFIGEGATSTGDFHEALNIASVWKLPFILVIENNRWAFSTPTSQQYACDHLADRALGYGIPGVQVDGTDAEAVLSVMQTAVARARAGDGPTLVEAMLGRHRGHSEGDDSLQQVPEQELQQYVEQDPLDLVEKRLIDGGVFSRAWIDEVRERCASLVTNTVDQAMSMPEPDVHQPRSIYAD
ncbi:MAG: thiamine pyrophosphate-dependent dehydrogenase E1 component subunit alpha [Planctomycetes bacterium]|jgi:TPP-dependent pyruvate/acetoin dehydrogenase alpha subunit|nr:thiamine pyrophosphate-dependent dehydrogenase E1 component subunit alpha [Planctomycetota bacterium]MBT6453787.1 thiamine pyrophosphate-dependent dehydrogenase E1 component subunit alpha [Planctomycetota bacterium]MBT6541301.1 thiamine pyrophosphate-dependent dehydrogenase E1 component subunit alpha [Planctomycetota bacterium]MBT6783488.1 thiamine pyrophosphate-dependent dehydrogenase E1 component subunit alpha [Planctomycetota bacterium]MBT6969017.1 thiamine pyrophosphate-dependent dehydro